MNTFCRLNGHMHAGAIQRYFESRKINVRESDPSQKDRVAIQAKSRRQRSRRSRVSCCCFFHTIVC